MALTSFPSISITPFFEMSMNNIHSIMRIYISSNKMYNLL
ncbi:hypothetical protein CLOSCI_02584 [[Clostridium] scindens ATCC 35704]|nr:hypothetical protein CLOSCI_02584 [[Clostridium] scindens ATCC 35704]